MLASPTMLISNRLLGWLRAMKSPLPRNVSVPSFRDKDVPISPRQAAAMAILWACGSVQARKVSLLEKWDILGVTESGQEEETREARTRAGA